ncbi:hypothetical protein JTB14_014768 [Gonioctena quinquepunctata]|nr:hypothetical protein JTB14_014768 [Gonioctena quinquepunctata]
MICCESIVSNLEIEEEVLEDLTKVSGNPLEKEITYLRTIITHKNFIIRELLEKVHFLQNKNDASVSWSRSENHITPNIQVPRFDDDLELKLNLKTGVAIETSKPTSDKRERSHIMKTNMDTDSPKTSTSKQEQSRSTNEITKQQVSTAILQAETINTFKKIQNPNVGSKNDNEIGEGWQTAQSRHKKRRKFLVGDNAHNANIQTVPRLVSFHVTRLKPKTHQKN